MADFLGHCRLLNEFSYSAFSDIRSVVLVLVLVSVPAPAFSC